MKNAVKVKPNYKNNTNHTVVETNKEMLMCMCMSVIYTFVYEESWTQL